MGVPRGKGRSRGRRAQRCAAPASPADRGALFSIQARLPGELPTQPAVGSSCGGWAVGQLSAHGPPSCSTQDLWAPDSDCPTLNPRLSGALPDPWARPGSRAPAGPTLALLSLAGHPRGMSAKLCHQLSAKPLPAPAGRLAPSLAGKAPLCLSVPAQSLHIKGHMEHLCPYGVGDIQDL